MKITLELPLSEEASAELKAMNQAAKAFHASAATGKKPDAKAAAKAAPADDGDDADADNGDDTDAEDNAEDDADADGEPDADFDEGDGGTKTTRDNVRDALKKVAKKKNQTVAIDAMEKAGGTRSLSALKESKFDAVIAACNKIAK